MSYYFHLLSLLLLLLLLLISLLSLLNSQGDASHSRAAREPPDSDFSAPQLLGGMLPTIVLRFWISEGLTQGQS